MYKTITFCINQLNDTEDNCDEYIKKNVVRKSYGIRNNVLLNFRRNYNNWSLQIFKLNQLL